MQARNAIEQKQEGGRRLSAAFAGNALIYFFAGCAGAC